MNLRKLKHLGDKSAREIKQAELMRQRKAHKYHINKLYGKEQQRLKKSTYHEAEPYSEQVKETFDRVSNIKPTKIR